MKKRSLITITIISLLGIYYYLNKKKPQVVNETPTFTSETGKPHNLNPDSKNDEILSLIKTENAPITFYGIVVDEEGRPLARVNVNWSIIKAGAFFPSLGQPTGARGVLVTDNDGRFVLNNETGTSFGVEALEKVGYIDASPDKCTYGYGSNSAPHAPDEQNPEKFVMVREGTEKPVKVNLPLKFDWDGKLKQYDIKLADEVVTVHLTPQVFNENATSEAIKWRLLFEIANAKIIEVKDIEAPIAPMQGYTDTLEFSGSRKGSTVQAWIYAKTSEGKYMQIQFRAYSDRSSDTITGRIIILYNRSGGRVFPR